MTEGAVPEIYVQPGESHLITGPAMLRTVLGSCVGVTFRSARLGVAALCHPMLPAYPAHSRAALSVAEGRRYVDYAVRDLIRQFDALGARRAEIEVKLFGGGDVLVVSHPGVRPTVGKLNCESALKVLGEEGLEVVASSLGGTCGLNLQFSTLTGEVRVKRLSAQGRPCVIDQSIGKKPWNTLCPEENP